MGYNEFAREASFLLLAVIRAIRPARPGFCLKTNGPARPGFYKSCFGPAQPGPDFSKGGPARPGFLTMYRGPARPGPCSTACGPARGPKLGPARVPPYLQTLSRPHEYVLSELTLRCSRILTARSNGAIHSHYNLTGSLLLSGVVLQTKGADGKLQYQNRKQTDFP